MRVGIISNSIETGGAQRVCLKMLEALKEAGYEVSLITLKKPDWFTVERMFGSIVKPDQEIVLLKWNFPAFDAYKPLFAAILIPSVAKKFKLDLLINSQGDTLPVRANIIYVHYPTFSEYEHASINLKYSRSLFWRIYIAPYKLIHRFFKKYLESGLIVTNGIYSKRAIKKHIGKEPFVLTPPVGTEAFNAVASSLERENIVVTCGRYSPEKNYETMLRVAKDLSETDFKVVGSYSGEKSSRYYKKLSSLKSNENLLNVSLLRDLSFCNLLELYSKSKVYLHTMKDEHFGIAIVEAMAAGLVPVVFKTGGPWEDILKTRQGYYGFSYKNANEAANIIKMILSNENLRKKISERNVIYVKNFSDTLFKEKFSRIVKNIISGNANGQGINT
jgi:alpha-1,2-mannosyltransferase